MANVPVQTPAGVKMVPEEKLDFYVSQGAKPVVKMLDDTGKPKWVPQNMVDTAVHKLGGSFPAPPGTPQIKQFVPPGLQGPPEQNQSAWDTALQTPPAQYHLLPGTNAGIGMLKGMVHTGYGLASLAKQAVGMSAIDEPKSLQPANTEQKLGFGGEQALEFMAPETPVKWLSALGGDSRIAQVLLKGAGQMAFGTGIQMAHDAEHPKQAALSGAAGTALGLGMEGAMNAGKNLAASTFNWAMRPGARGLMGAKNFGVQAMEDGGFGFLPSMEKFADLSGERAHDAYAARQALLSRTGGTVDLSGPRFDAHTALYDAMEQGPINDPTVAQYQRVAEQFEPTNYGERDISQFPIEKAAKLRQGLYSQMYFQPGVPYEKPVQQVMRGLTGDIGGIVDQAAPGFQDINTTYGNYASLRNAARARIPYMKQTRPFFPIMSAIGGGELGSIAGSRGAGAVLGGLMSKFTVNPAYSYTAGRGAAMLANPFLNRYVGGLAAGMFDKMSNTSDTQMLPTHQ